MTRANTERRRRRYHLQWLCVFCGISDAGCAIRFIVTGNPCCDDCEHPIKRKATP